MPSSHPGQKLYAEVAEAIRSEIERGVLQPGHKLPTLAEMAARFGCSRATIREAIGALRGQGLVELRHGDGIYIRSASVEMWMEPIDAAILLGVSEVRDLVEMQTAVLAGIASVAAQRRAQSDYSALSRALFELECAAGQRDMAVASELTFYMTLAEVAQNAVLENALRILQEALRSSLRTLNPKLGLGVKTCRAVYDAVQMEDDETARNVLFAYGREIFRQIERVRGLIKKF